MQYLRTSHVSHAFYNCFAMSIALGSSSLHPIVIDDDSAPASPAPSVDSDMTLPVSPAPAVDADDNVEIALPLPVADPQLQLELFLDIQHLNLMLFLHYQADAQFDMLHAILWNQAVQGALGNL